MQSSLSLSPSDIEQLIADRRDFHAHPELAYSEQRTATVVAERLAGYGYEVSRRIGRMGVVGLIEGTKAASEADSASTGAAARTLLYRADMDALPVREEND